MGESGEDMEMTTEETLRMRVAWLENANTDLEKRLAEAQGEVGALEDKVAHLHGREERYRAKIESQKRHCENLQDIITERNKRIAELEAQLASAHEECAKALAEKESGGAMSYYLTRTQRITAWIILVGLKLLGISLREAELEMKPETVKLLQDYTMVRKSEGRA